MGQQEIHEHEAPGGGHGRRLRCRLTSLSRSLQTILRINLDGTNLHGNVSRLVEELQVRRAKTPTISDRCLGFSLNIAWQNLNGQVTF